MARLISVLLIIWLVIGAVAAYQRDYFANDDTNCAEVGNIALTIVAGPLNYTGVNPKVDCDKARLPEPSK